MNKSFHNLLRIYQFNVNRLSLKDALKRKYKVYLLSKGKRKYKTYQCRIYVPLCFKNKKVKLRLIK